MNEPVEQNSSRKTARWVSKPQIKLYVSARRNHQSYHLNDDVDLVNVGTWGDQLSFGIVNRNWRPGYRKKGAKIITIKENPGKIIRTFIDQILLSYFKVKIPK